MSRPRPPVLLLALLGALACTCAPSLPEAYERSRAAAERAYSHGRYEEAAEHWRRAAQSAERKKDRADAMYRYAVSLRRSGRGPEAAEALRLLLKDYPKSHRADRAVYDLADLALDSGDREAGLAALAEFVRARPTSPLALHAADRYFEQLQEREGTSAAEAWAKATSSAVKGSAVEELLLFRLGQSQEASGDTAAALGSYRRLVAAFPYPRGAYWDDALLRAARLERAGGNPDRALALIAELMRERESADLQGSYEKPVYAEARLERAGILADQGRTSAALDELRRIYQQHQHSRLRDDALWRESRLAHAAGMKDRACDAATVLIKNLPESRYAPCAHLLCPSAPRAKGQCRAYIERELGESAP
ncbi:MAG: tetratricopeptide repeat protein [Polyangiaceae bacterium]